MLWWMAITSSGSHGIHATSPPFYQYLGEPASHGCIRQHRTDAHTLYEMVDVGTPVYVSSGGRSVMGKSWGGACLAGLSLLLVCGCPRPSRPPRPRRRLRRRR